MVMHKVQWLHELVYTIAGQSDIYDELSIVLFVDGCMYLAAMELEKQSHGPLMAHHLQELMADAEFYGREPVLSYKLPRQWPKLPLSNSATWNSPASDAGAADGISHPQAKTPQQRKRLDHIKTIAAKMWHSLQHSYMMDSLNSRICFFTNMPPKG